jgi:F420-0:gamma-glutamyl ligase
MRANAGGCGGCLASGMSAANDNDIVVVAHALLSATEAPLLAMADTTPFVSRSPSP